MQWIAPIKLSSPTCFLIGWRQTTTILPNQAGATTRLASNLIFQTVDLSKDGKLYCFEIDKPLMKCANICSQICQKNGTQI